eukprot:581331-Pelagomonas_calceolata.AAC.3
MEDALDIGHTTDKVRKPTLAAAFEPLLRGQQGEMLAVNTWKAKQNRQRAVENGILRASLVKATLQWVKRKITEGNKKGSERDCPMVGKHIRDQVLAGCTGSNPICTHDFLAMCRRHCCFQLAFASALSLN